MPNILYRQWLGVTDINIYAMLLKSNIFLINLPLQLDNINSLSTTAGRQ